MGNLIAVASFGSRIQGDLAHSALEAAGIESTLRDDEGGGQYPNLAFAEGVMLLVADENVEAAREILAGIAPAESGVDPGA